MTTTVAIVDHPTAEDLVIWHVQIGPESPGELSGAWILPPTDPRASELLADCAVMVTPRAQDCGDALIGQLATPPVRTSAAAIREILADTLTQYREEFRAALDAGGSKPKRPTWPQLPDALEEAAPQVPVPPGGDPRSAQALAVALWVRDAARTWDDLERLRVTRRYLAPQVARERRPLPLADVLL